MNCKKRKEDKAPAAVKDQQQKEEANEQWRPRSRWSLTSEADDAVVVINRWDEPPPAT